MNNKNQPTHEFIYGIHPVLEALKAKQRKIFSLYTTKPTPAAWGQIESIIKERHIPVHFVARETLNSITATTDHQGILAWVNPFPFRNKPFDPEKSPFLVLLDGIQDPRNVGAILRSAYCTNASGIIITKKNSAPLNAAAIKASAGLAEHLPIMMVPSAVSIMPELKKAGYQIYLAAFKGENATAITFTKPLCLVIGSEGSGISNALYHYGTRITLPQKSPDISYNASVAAGILLFMISSQLKNIN